MIRDKEHPEGRKIKPDDIAVIVRKWENGEDIKKRLAARNIPAAVLKAGNVFATAPAEELQTVLEGILNVTDSSSLKKALVTPICGLTFDDLTSQDSDILAMISKKTADLAELGKIWHKQSFYIMFKKMLSAFDVEKRFTLMPDGLRNLTDLIQLGDLLHQESSRRNPAPQALLDYLIFNRSHYSEQFPRDQETDSGAVIIISGHSSKGLQYPIVILPDLCNKGQAPSTYHKAGILTAGEEKEADKQYANDEMIQEALRLAYVAITRAEHACFVLATEVGKKGDNLTSMNWLWFKRKEELSAEASPSLRLQECKNRELTDDMMEPPPPPGDMFTPERDDSVLEAQSFDLHPSPTITTSFTGMSPGHAGQFIPPAPDGKEDDETGQEPPQDTDNKLDPLRRLRGNTFGLLLHGIMEYLDFKASDETIREKVEQEILLSEPTEEELAYSTSVISNTLKTQLMDDFRISDIRPEKRCAEMKFHFGFDSKLKKGDICKFAAEYMGEEYEKKQDDHLYNGGFVTGSIDLLFEHEGKYYILDWKSNLLQDYKQDTLKDSMVHSFYQMQYLIYLTALMRFLKQRLGLPEFGEAEYDKYIGGAYYIYMRGAGADPDDPRNGVYFDRPAYSQIQEVAGLLK